VIENGRSLKLRQMRQADSEGYHINQHQTDRE
jgi:hypothetical protein